MLIDNGFKWRSLLLSLPLWISTVSTGIALSLPSTMRNTLHGVPVCGSTGIPTRLFLATTTDDKDDDGGDFVLNGVSVWSPKIRKVMAGIASFGAIETMYLTFVELTEDPTTKLPFCSTESTCNSVITSPYAYLPGTEIPLAIMGVVAYSVAFVLAVTPLLQSKSAKDQQNTGSIDDSENRVLLLAVTTAMGAFSVFLMSVLFNVLHQTCMYCIASAICSIGLASLAWLGGALPDNLRKEGVSISVGGGMFSLLIAVALVVANEPVASSTAASNFLGKDTTSLSTSLLATTESFQASVPAGSDAEQFMELRGQLPPEVTTDSTDSAMQLAADLQSLDARFYGAYWCSHCFEQKQAFGKQAMQRIPYVECSKEGMNAQVSFCKEKNIPGYPTWEISGKLYPGEKALDEIRDIVVSVKNAAIN
jgi:uncharacterized membrane protein